MSETWNPIEGVSNDSLKIRDFDVVKKKITGFGQESLCFHLTRGRTIYLYITAGPHCICESNPIGVHPAPRPMPTASGDGGLCL